MPSEVGPYPIIFCTVCTSLSPRPDNFTSTMPSAPTSPPAARNLLAARLDADEPDLFVVHERVEHAERVAAAADARDNRMRQATGELDDLRASLPADHRLELADHQRVGMRPEDRAEQVVR